MGPKKNPVGGSNSFAGEFAQPSPKLYAPDVGPNENISVPFARLSFLLPSGCSQMRAEAGKKMKSSPGFNYTWQMQTRSNSAENCKLRHLKELANKLLAVAGRAGVHQSHGYGGHS